MVGYQHGFGEHWLCSIFLGIVMVVRSKPKVGVRLPSPLAQFTVGLGLALLDFGCRTYGHYLLFPLCPLLVFPSWPLSVKTVHLLCWIQAFLRCKFEVESCGQESGIKTSKQASLFSLQEHACRILPLLGLEKWLSSLEYFCF